MKTRISGLLAGIAVALTIYFLPIADISQSGKTALALTLMTIIFWICNVAHNGFVALLYCALVILLGIADPTVVFGSWTKNTFWMIIASFLIAAATNNSGLTERLANAISLKLIRDYRSVIITVALLNVVLAIIVPNVFPRCFLILAIVTKICKSVNLGKNDTIKLGYATFALALPSILIFLTSDSSLNSLLLSYVPEYEVGWIGWFIHMGIPALISEILITALFILLFKPEQNFTVDKNLFAIQLKQMGSLTKKEKKCLVWIAILVIFWLTDSLHHIDISYGTLFIAVLMTLPLIGNLVTAEDWKSIPLNLLCFLTGSMAIGAVGAATGMNDWIAATIMPSSMADNPFVLALFITVISMILHIFIGSTVTIMAVAIPIFLNFTAGMSIQPLCVLFLIYNTIVLQYFFSFQQLTLTSGVDMVGYKHRHTLRMGIPMTGLILVINCLICVPWWNVTGFLN